MLDILIGNALGRSSLGALFGNEKEASGSVLYIAIFHPRMDIKVFMHSKFYGKSGSLSVYYINSAPVISFYSKSYDAKLTSTRATNTEPGGCLNPVVHLYRDENEIEDFFCTYIITGLLINLLSATFTQKSYILLFSRALLHYLMFS